MDSTRTTLKGTFISLVLNGLILTTVVSVVSMASVVGAADTIDRLAVRANVANVRAGPGVSQAVLWQVEKYYPVIQLEKKGDWIRFKDFEGDQGWLHASLLSRMATVIVRANLCNIRTGPGTQYSIAFTVDKGIPFKVLQTKGKWIEIQHADGDKGWIFKGLVW